MISTHPFCHKTPTTHINTLSLHDALPISHATYLATTQAEARPSGFTRLGCFSIPDTPPRRMRFRQDRKSTRLNSSHTVISYAVFCLKKKRNNLISRVDRCSHLNAMKKTNI